jgi:hypothetical protein
MRIVFDELPDADLRALEDAIKSPIRVPTSRQTQDRTRIDVMRLRAQPDKPWGEPGRDSPGASREVRIRG